MIKKRSIFASGISMTVMAMSITMLGFILPEISDRFVLTIGQAGILFSINFLGFAIFTLLGGPIAERIGSRILIQTALFGLAIASMLLSVADNYTIVIILMFLYGGFGGIIETFVSAYVTELEPANADYNINLAQVFFGIGAVIAPVGTGYIISKGNAYSICYFVLGMVALLAAVNFLFTERIHTTNSIKLQLKDIKDLVANKMFILTCVCMACYTGAEIGIWGWISTISTIQFSLSLFESSLVLSGFWLTMTIGRYLLGKLCLRIKLEKLIAISAVFATLFVVLIRFSNNKMFFPAVFLVGVACSSLFPFILAFGNKHIKKGKNSGFSLFLISSNIGSITVPYLMGQASEKIGMNIGMLIPALFLAIVAGVFGCIMFTGNSGKKEL